MSSEAKKIPKNCLGGFAPKPPTGTLSL